MLFSEWTHISLEIRAVDDYFFFVLVIVGEITTVAVLINSDIIRIDDIGMTIVWTMNLIIKCSGFFAVYCAIHTVGALSHAKIRCWVSAAMAVVANTKSIERARMLVSRRFILRISKGHFSLLR